MKLFLAAFAHPALSSLSWKLDMDQTPMQAFRDNTINYTTITGYFWQDNSDTEPDSFDFKEHNFGLIDRSYSTDLEVDPEHAKSQWQRFSAYVDRLNKATPDHVDYKVLFLGRHGEAWHNVASEYYGHQAWEDYWSRLPGNGSTNWTDPHLTPEGAKQAQGVHQFWEKQLSPLSEHMPEPQAFYVSPLARCLETARLTFAGLTIDRQSTAFKKRFLRFQPVVKEYLRETIGVHTCDQRSSKTWILENYPGYMTEHGFTELDQLWTPGARETHEHMIARARLLLNSIFIFGAPSSTWVSFTAHGGITRAILEVLGHREWHLGTSDVVPVFVKMERGNGR